MLIKNEFKPRMVQNTQKQIPQAINENNGRLRLLSALIVLCFVAFVCIACYRYYNKDNTPLAKASENNLVRSIREPALRGRITDRNGIDLAVSRPIKMATFSPNMIYVPNKNGKINWNIISDTKFQQIAAILELPEKEVRAKLQNRDKKYVYFSTPLTLSQAEELKKLKIPTMVLKERTERTYPTGPLFSHIVGFYNSRGNGSEGIEFSKNKELTGVDGVQKVLQNKSGNVVAMLDDAENKLAQNGKDIVLSLDYDMQRLAREELASALKQFNAKAGGVVVLDAQTGEILALSSLPDYDANFYQDYPVENRKNFAISATMEPGSIMKPFVIAKALDSGKISRYSYFDTQPYQLAQKQIKDTHLYPSLSVEGILQKSSNVGTSRIALMMENQELYDYYRSIGIGSKTNSGIAGEQYQVLKPAEKWGRLDKAVMSYGYSLAVNLLQMAQGYTIFTTDGKLMPVTVYKQETAPQGKQIIKPETAKAMREMMISITQKGGTGQAGAIEGIDVAAKTGTAKKNKANGGYEDKYRASFVGFAPALNPKLIVAVTIDEPRNGIFYGGTVAGPVFRNVMSGGLDIMNGVRTHFSGNAIASR